MSQGADTYSREAASHAARTLVASRTSGQMFAQLSQDERPRTVDDGYLVQEVAREILARQGYGRHGGWKIGCTTKVMQNYLNVASPVSGTMFRHSMWNDRHRFDVAPPRVLGVECEVAVRLGEDLATRERPYSPDDVARAVVAAMAAIEVVEDRYVDYRSLDTPTLVADDFFHYGCVIGSAREDVNPRELVDVNAVMRINGVEVGRGRGSDILGDPMVALAWLANKCASRATPLLAGDVVLLGSVVQTQWVAPGDSVEIDNDVLGVVDATFGVRPPTLT